ncbi:MAG: flagellar hook-length control protein FliK [Curvibacter sp.]|nr:MAG: flagellar hook-length control protein FliK [Curvibacter sp.]
MTIESTTSTPTGKSAQSSAVGKTAAASAGAGGAAGFLAMLSAADDALALPTDGSDLTNFLGCKTGTLLEEEQNLTALDTDASALAEWLLAVPMPAPQEAATRAHSRHGGLSAPVVDAGSSSLASATSRKSGKTLGTSELQQVQTTVHSPAVLQGYEQVARQISDVKPALMPDVAPLPVPDSREAPAVAVLIPLVERQLLEPIGVRAAPVDGVYSQSQSATAPLGMDGVVSNQSSAPMDSYVAEQVKYWISQDVKSAELTLDGMGFSPVEVSISMQGNEAQVEFRTDESNAREAIEQASEHLKESLLRQGVVLAGMSVGTSHGGGASGQERRQRDEGRQAKMTVLEPLQVPGAGRQPTSMGRAVDLFV